MITFHKKCLYKEFRDLCYNNKLYEECWTNHPDFQNRPCKDWERKLKIYPPLGFRHILEICSKCSGENHFYCKKVVEGLFIDCLYENKPQKGKLRCNKAIELKIY